MDKSSTTTTNNAYMTHTHHTPIAETIKAKAPKTLAKNFKKRTIEIHGPKKERHKSSAQKSEGNTSNSNQHP